MQLQGKRALVTGGAVRIGRAICESLAAAGCDLAIQYRHSEAEARKLAQQLQSNGINAVTIQTDLSNMQDVSRLVPETRRLLGSLDILINNAAVFNKTCLLDSPPEVVQSELDVNALAPLALMRAFARTARNHSEKLWPNAAIINILDRRVARVEKGALPYVLSKNMLRDATQIAALELGPHIRVNAVAPGPILPPPGEGEDYLAERAGPLVLGLRPAPADIANAVVFLLQADTITGQVIYVDSGQHLL